MHVLTLDYPKRSTTRGEYGMFRVACKQCGRPTVAVRTPKNPTSCSTCLTHANRTRTAAQRARKWLA